jgi:hypothetical protein
MPPKYEAVGPARSLVSPMTIGLDVVLLLEPADEPELEPELLQPAKASAIVLASRPPLKRLDRIGLI